MDFHVTYILFSFSFPRPLAVSALLSAMPVLRRGAISSGSAVGTLRLLATAAGLAFLLLLAKLLRLFLGRSAILFLLKTLCQLLARKKKINT
jgi:hypothetical protein